MISVTTSWIYIITGSLAAKSLLQRPSRQTFPIGTLVLGIDWRQSLLKDPISFDINWFFLDIFLVFWLTFFVAYSAGALFPFLCHSTSKLFSKVLSCSPRGIIIFKSSENDFVLPNVRCVAVVVDVAAGKIEKKTTNNKPWTFILKDLNFCLYSYDTQNCLQ